jgi:hypothetical protein
MRRAWVVIAALVAAGVLTGCRDGSPEPAPGEARLVEHTGTVEVSTDGRTWTDASGGTLQRGERVRVRRGAAVLELAHGARAELRDGSQVAIDRRLRLITGDLLVRAGEEAPVTVDATSALASVQRGGDARFERALAFDTAVYDGAVDLRSGSRTFRVAALRQVSVPGVGLLPDPSRGRGAPLEYRPDDTWDREFLGAWMELGADLLARSNGLSGQVGRDQGRTAGYYRLLLPALEGERAFTQELVDTDADLPPGERLIGAAIVVASERERSFVARWQDAFEFRREGAAWGLVALDQRVGDRIRLVGDVDAALARAVTRPDVVAAAAEPPGPDTDVPRNGGSPGAGTGGGSGSTPPSSTPPATNPPPTTLPPTTQPPVPILPLPTLPPPGGGARPSEPSDPTGNDTLAELTDTLVETVGGLLGGLQPPP